ncbi:twin-arginine translocation signal domain-containing protein [Marinoscillum furvescens]|uniref:Secreted protein n=1 Tax=Marinoscillum furvescens DSM 4134 TaxID=1122208 RepID=A0A3D9L0J6_MARFU|nr:twin-arginine translocation signal domain-containing protein [Marinoscillum furvescens]RED94667.1 secreted protein [Marinoscillum furvescens DSM 4134]
MLNSESRRNFLKKTAIATAGFSVGITTLSTACRQKVLGGKSFEVLRNGRTLSFQLPIEKDLSHIEVRLFSKANEYIFEYDDVSPHAPDVENEQTKDVWMPGFDEAAEARRKSSQEQRFPVVDLAIKPDMSAVIEMDIQEPGTYRINDQDIKPLTDQIRIPYQKVDHWANSFYIDPKTNSIKHFYLAAQIAVVNSKVSFQIETLRDDWVGAISIHDPRNGEMLASSEVTWETELPDISTGKGVTRERMVAALSLASDFLLNCQYKNPNSKAFGGEYLLYDLTARTRMRPFWSWAWGPSAKVLFEAADIEGVSTSVSNSQLKQRAEELMQLTLDLQVLDKDSPAYGIIQTSAHEASTVDSLFLVGWGWMSLYKETKNPKYIEAGKKLADAANRLMDEHDDVWIPQAYLFEEDRWKDIMSFESSMGLPGLAALYLATGDDYFKKTTIRMADLLIRAFENEEGLWGVFFRSKTMKTDEVNYWTKAFGYIADGLIEAHRAAPEKGYLAKAMVIADRILATQAADGSLSVRFDRSPQYVGIGDKATAIWGALYLRLYKMVGDKKYYTAGMKAIEWCMDHQYVGDDTAARGGIVGRSWPSGINFRHWYDVVVTYTVSFFGSALLEALSLDEWKE